LGADARAEVDPDALARFREAMDDDLDTPGALAHIFDLVSQANAAGDAGDEARASSLALSVAVLAGALGLVLHAGTGGEVDDETARLMRERDAARAAKDWARADALRDEMVTRGWTVEDGAEGTTVRR
jgi:cysteinyl-tRNA synthetase